MQEWGTLLIFILIEKLEFNSRKKWEIFSKEIPSSRIDDFNKFLSQRCQVLEALDNKVSQPQNPGKTRGTFLGLENSENSSQSCPVCKKSHFIYFCDKFKALSIDSRFEKQSDFGFVVIVCHMVIDSQFADPVAVKYAIKDMQPYCIAQFQINLL